LIVFIFNVISIQLTLIIFLLPCFYCTECADGMITYTKNGETYATPMADVVEFAKARTMWTSDLYDNLSEEEKMQVVHDVANLYLIPGVEFDEMREERDAEGNGINPTHSTLPHVLPESVACYKDTKFIKLFNSHKEHIRSFYGNNEVDGDSALYKLFKDFKRAYRNNDVVRRKLQANRSSEKTLTFNEAWDGFPAIFLPLRNFFAGFATVFPNTATVKSDFSILSYEKGDYCQSLADISIGSIMHSKQCEEVKLLPLQLISSH